MIVQINFPKWAMGIEDGTVVKWLKDVGDIVQAGEPLVEIETAKATQDVESPVSGRLVKITAEPGQEVAVNTTLGEIDDADIG